MNEELLNLCISIAREAHLGQKRATGEDYITHPEAVAKQMGEIEDKAIAWLHDVLEDTPVTFYNLDHWLVGFRYRPYIMIALRCLTKKRNEKYLNYIKRVMTNPDAIKVKLADLKHNLSTCPKSWKKNKDKWELAKYILEER